MSGQVLRCSVAQESLGVLVLGALDPTERDEVEAHVRACASCSAELADLAPLPGLLTRLDVSFIEDSKAPAAILERALQQVHAHQLGHFESRRRRRGDRRSWLLVGVAAVAMLIAGVAGARSAQVFPFAESSSLVASAANTVTGVKATVTILPATPGTHVNLTLSGVAPGAHCQLIAIGKDGQREILAAWVASYDGEAHVAGTTGLPTGQLSSFDVTTPQGSTLVSVELPA